MAKSIYQLICDNIKNGVLEENFSAPDESDDSPIKWASGAMDGVYIFHMNHSAALGSYLISLCCLYA